MHASINITASIDIRKLKDLTVILKFSLLLNSLISTSFLKVFSPKSHNENYHCMYILRRALVRRHSYHFLSLRLVRNPSGFFRKIPDKRERQQFNFTYNRLNKNNL